MSRIEEVDQSTNSPIFVPDEVMDEIDKIHLRHYNTEDSLDTNFGLLCLSCHRCSHEVPEAGGIPICQELS